MNVEELKVISSLMVCPGRVGPVCVLDCGGIHGKGKWFCKFMMSEGLLIDGHRHSTN